MTRTTTHDRADEDRTGTNGASGDWHHDASATRDGPARHGDHDV
jgi:hypothetical protein